MDALQNHDLCFKNFKEVYSILLWVNVLMKLDLIRKESPVG